MSQHHADPPRMRLPRILGFVLLALFLLCGGTLVLLPGPLPSRESARRSACTNNLKQIGYALQNYHAAFKQFPPAYVVDADGKPMHSWRALLLHYFEEPQFEHLAKQYDFAKPWDNPSNLQLADKVSRLFQCPSDDGNAGQTNYVAVVGETAAWPERASRRLSEIVDGTSNTISVIEVIDSGIPGWSRAI